MIELLTAFFSMLLVALRAYPLVRRSAGEEREREAFRRQQEKDAHVRDTLDSLSRDPAP